MVRGSTASVFPFRASMFAGKEAMVGVYRVFIFRVLLLLAASSRALSMCAADWTFDTPTLGARRPAARAPLPGEDFPAPESRLVSFDDPAGSAADSPPEPIAPGSSSGTFPSAESVQPDEHLLPIAMPDAAGEDLPPTAPTFSSGRWFNRGRWYARAELTYLTISEKKSTNLAIDFSDPNQIPTVQRNLFRTQKGDGYSPGARMTVGVYLGIDPWNRDSSLEFTYFGLSNFQRHPGLVLDCPEQPVHDARPVIHGAGLHASQPDVVRPAVPLQQL